MARGPNPVRVLDYALLLICFSVLISMLPGFGEALPYASTLFYLVIPGYAFMRTFFANVLGDEKFLALIAFSIALSTFIKVLTEVLLRGETAYGTVILNFLSIAMLSSAIIRDRGSNVAKSSEPRPYSVLDKRQEYKNSDNG